MDRQAVGETAASRVRPRFIDRVRKAHIPATIAALFLASMAACAWLSMRSRVQAARAARAKQIVAVGDILAQSAEVMLASGDLSALRRIVSDAARSYELSDCCVSLPNGAVVADADIKGITLSHLPETWTGAAAESQMQVRNDEELSRVIPLVVPGRGSARLEIAARADASNPLHGANEVGIGAISVVTLLALMVLYRFARVRLQGISAIRQSLLEYNGRPDPASELSVNPEWGPEAQAWNGILDQMSQQRKQVACEKTRQAFHARASGRSELNEACDLLSQGLILVDENGGPKYVNNAATVLLQMKHEDVLSSDIVGVLDDERVREAIRTATDGGLCKRTIVELERSNASGQVVLRCIVRPVRRGDRGLAMIVLEDVTQRRVAEKARGAFVAQATHELRTPLTNIRLYLETILDEGENAPAVRANGLNVISQEVVRLDRMVGDILSVAEIEAGSLKLKRDDVHLDVLFETLEKDYAAQASDKQISLRFDLPPKFPVIQADRDKVALGLHNLIGNALKYTLSGGSVTVRVTADRGQLKVDVTDTGIGIAPDDCERIFDKFYRARDKRVADTTGSGLGLAIAREVTRLHGGDITVQSEPNTGSTFTFVLPLTKEAA